ncbi:MAG: hypothetical protein M0R33_18880 [Methylomonas sp.]|jgi:hypothetical protein|uniref:hypothetical protein n=1 Tax=Methylomonas sp. TaxID=418 RepID=UPI0025F82A8F|nr:hypothetical protein [Methylomonas sp.]MCK9608510.1 hypothetical protein [Methylomonas sp.]
MCDIQSMEVKNTKATDILQSAIDGICSQYGSIKGAWDIVTIAHNVRECEYRLSENNSEHITIHAEIFQKIAERWKTLSIIEARIELINFMRCLRYFDISKKLIAIPFRQLVERADFTNIGRMAFHDFLENSQGTQSTECELAIVEILTSMKAKNIFANLPTVLRACRGLGHGPLNQYYDGILNLLISTVLSSPGSESKIFNCVNFAIENGAELFNESDPWATIDAAHHLIMGCENDRIDPDEEIQNLNSRGSLDIAISLSCNQIDVPKNVVDQLAGILSKCMPRQQIIQHPVAKRILAQAKSAFAPIVIATTMPSKIADSPFSALGGDIFLTRWIWESIHSELF